ncbi:hypothetical protein [Frankia sp. CiP1_Cm_nod2]|uniref:hypothetical protein n=1 Tax=Frankia sp. CiP1_Cm_nod2 TaxID=2897161 RepID=UPI002024A384
MATNLFDDLKKALQDLKDFLNAHKGPVQQAVHALKAVGLPIGDLLTQLSGLLARLQTEIKNLDVSGVPGLSDISAFTGGVRSVLDAAKKLLPGDADAIGEVERIVDVVSSLPSLDQVKTEIIELIDTITGILGEINR